MPCLVPLNQDNILERPKHRPTVLASNPGEGISYDLGAMQDTRTAPSPEELVSAKKLQEQEKPILGSSPIKVFPVSSKLR
jgi:hypothetical protein